MKAAAVDIGTNSMRLLLVQRVGDGLTELGRYERVTGLGRGVDASGVLSEEAMDRTLLALAEFGARMSNHQVERRRAVATSAARDAANRELFFDRAELALGVRPELISGEEEARLSFLGATTQVEGPAVVIDIGGGSTEFVTKAGGVSFEIGSVRLTDRILVDRPASPSQVATARAKVAEILASWTAAPGQVLGVAGTWTSLASMEGKRTLTLEEITAWIERLAGMTAIETAGIPGLDPARASVILAGAIVAEGALRANSATTVIVCRRDLLDGVIAGLVNGAEE